MINSKIYYAYHKYSGMIGYKKTKEGSKITYTEPKTFSQNTGGVSLPTVASLKDKFTNDEGYFYYQKNDILRTNEKL